jgi:hypothetical protein
MENVFVQTPFPSELNERETSFLLFAELSLIKIKIIKMYSVFFTTLVRKFCGGVVLPENANSFFD